MQRVVDFFRCYLILSKRFLLKKSFVVILLLVPLLVGALVVISGNGDSGVLTVSLAMEDSDDPIACDLVSELTDGHGLIRFVLYDSVSEAKNSVETGNADAAWIFHKESDKSIRKFAQHMHANNAFVTVVQREESVFLRISHEKLNTVLYPYLAKALFFHKGEAVLPNVTEEELAAYYHGVNAEGDNLFSFVYAVDGGSDGTTEAGDMNLLISPVRGLLAVMVVLGGMAAAMFYMQDASCGICDRFSQKKEFIFSVSYQTAAVVMIGTAVFLTLILTQMSAELWYELLVMSVYCITTVLFCICLRLLLRDVRLFAAVTPVLIVGMIVLCPILFSAPKFPAIQYLLPPYYYLNAQLNIRFVGYMAVYAAALLALALLLHFFRGKRY